MLIAMLDDDARPFLSPHVRMRDSLALVTLRAPGIEISFARTAADVLRRAVPLMSGGLSVAEIRKEVGLSKSGFADLFGALAEHGHVTDVGMLVASRDLERQIEAYFKICDDWALEIFENPFWRIFLSGNASESQILGWGTEFYHRTLGADEHNLLAVRNCQYAEMLLGLKDHYEEELGHSEMFLRALVNCGINEDGLRAAAPIPTTRSLILYMSELAKSDSWGYLGCYGVLHSPRVGQTPDAASGQFEAFSRMYPRSGPVFDAFLKHTLLDLQLDHDKILLETLIRGRNYFSEDEAHRAIRGAWGMTQSFSSFFDGILEYY
ncbi:pyrroloquinoline quinone (PQQ) biosynthesis protein C [Bradyrhizobium sp. USDA 4341]